ncbi:ParB N-terminal domain-containing protein [Gluconobacter albidus]|uniref:ParB N-terminal domain-containing protein n=1 Tax=Gluconobacter TaxID=441 RepID=UPI001B8BA8EC|nr:MULTISPECIES: ParB N-terminal domain-containing protein [Gluconobacter]MBS1053746.1 ParB N-terminal domain-containing protein [Gluconobacter kondonii]MCP1274867.1 ParB N-terminal domain-containing protein [Gluconobacter albidus]
MDELRLVDPNILIANPNNPRQTKSGQASIRQLALNIRAVGLVHPPRVRELGDGSLMIIAGHRRTEAAIYAGLTEIQVHVTKIDNGLEDLAAASENMIREGMTEPDQWRAVTRMREDLGYTDQQLCMALMITPAYLRGLTLLAKLHPPILHAIEIGRGPDLKERRTLALSSLEDQAAAWAEMFAESVEEGEDPAGYRLNAEDPDDTVNWRDFTWHLRQDEWYARDARFDDALAQKHGVVWTEDLFGQGSEDNRYVTDATAFRAAQEDWIAEHRPEGTLAIETDEYGSPLRPQGYNFVNSWMGEQETDVVGYWLNRSTLKVEERKFRYTGEETVRSEPRVVEQTPPPKKERADISGTGLKMIGSVRTLALRKALEAKSEDADPWDLVAGLLLALNANNVHIYGCQSSSPQENAVKTAMEALFPEGELVRDEALIRRHALESLAGFMNCEVSMHSGSGMAAELLGCLFNADAHMPTMADEAFLKTYSKPGITKAVQAHGLAPLNTGKEMRAALLNAVGDGHWVPEAAGFAQAIGAWTEEVREQQARRAKWVGLKDELEDGDEDDLNCADAEDLENVMDEEGGEDAGEPDVTENEPTETRDLVVPQELVAMQAAMGGRLEILRV